MPRSNSRGGRNNNPKGRNQYSDRGVIEMVRERPFAATAAAAGAAAAGLFLWSKRTQISNQLSNLNEQIGEWREHMGSWSTEDDTTGLATTSRSNSEPVNGGATTRRNRVKATPAAQQ